MTMDTDGDHDETLTNYEVSVSIYLEATDPQDAVRQMVAWLDDSTRQARYTLTLPDGTSTYVDAENMNWR
jgi:hypothetical protein